MSLFDWSTDPEMNGVLDVLLPAHDGASARTYMPIVRALMARLAAYAADQSALVTTGSANAYAVATASGVTTLTDGFSLTLRPHQTNTDKPSLNVDGTGPKPWVGPNGAPLPVAGVQTGRVLRVVFDGASSAWHSSPAVGLDDLSASINAPGTRAAFAASSPPAVQRAIQLQGFALPGDGGGATYARLSAKPALVQAWHVQVADGSWWGLTGDDIDVRVLGAVGGDKAAAVSSLPNDYAALQAAFDYVGYTGGRLHLPGNLQFRTDTGLVAKINRQLPPAPTNQDIHFLNNSRFDLVSTGGGAIVAGAAMGALLTLIFNTTLSNIAPFKSKVEGFELRGNGMAQFGITSNYAMHTVVEGNCLDGFTSACLNWTGYGVARILRNVLRGPCCIRFQGGGGDSVIAWNDYFLPNNGRAIWIGALGGNLIIEGGTYNGEGSTGCIGVDVSVDGAGTDEIRHIVVSNAEFSGMVYGVRALKSASVRNVYGLMIKGNHVTPAAGGAVHTGVLAHLTGIDSALIHHNICNGMRGAVASASAVLAYDCEDIHFDHNVIGNYSGPAAYFSNVRRSSFNGNKVRDVGQAGASGVIIDLDGGTANCQINDNAVTQTSASFAQNGIYERAGATGNEARGNRWIGVGLTGVVAAGSTSVFRRFTGTFAEGSANQNGATASVNGARNIAVARASTGRTTITFSSAHPDTNYTPKVTGVGCKVEVEAKASTGFTVLMLDLADNPIDAGFEVEVTSRVA